MFFAKPFFLLIPVFTKILIFEVMEAAHYNFNIYNSIVLGGIIQGLIFGVVVATSKKYRDKSTLLLATLIVVFSLNNFQYYLTSTSLLLSRNFYNYIWTPGQLAMGPLFYLYGLKLLYPEKPIPKKTIFLAFSPFVLGLIWVTYLKIRYDYVGHEFDYLIPEIIMEFTSMFLAMGATAKLFFGTKKAEQQAQAIGFSRVAFKLQWFRNILLTFFFLSWVWLTVIVLIYLGIAPFKTWNIIWVALSIMIYWIGHVGIYKYGVMEERKKIRNHSPDRSSIIDVSDRKKSEHLIQFENLLIDKKYFLDPELTLDKISDELNLSKSHLSRLINTELKTSFPDYINHLRIKEAQYYLKHPDFSNYTLVAIGLEAGFASKTTFNNTFKKVTGMTPSEYKNLAVK